MILPSLLGNLRELDRLRALALDHVPAFAHDDHRFVLPLVHYAQEQRHLPRPCGLVMLDQHADALSPRSQAMETIREMRSDEMQFEQLLHSVTHELSDLDDDWMRTGMELGMFSDAVIFGVDDPPRRNLTEFDDHLGVLHRIWINSSLPGECFGHQGNLSDFARSYAVQPLWELLDWEIGGESVGFSDGAASVFVSLDLDAFVMDWEDFTFPWPNEVWDRKFLNTSNHHSAAGWSGKRFMHALLRRGGILTIAREPVHCGGEDKMQRVFDDLNHFVFDGALGDVAP